ncbi:MAG: signal peptidase I [Magnetospirillum sp.]|nr:signal peptidase I [Magnetospirillum sp.]
MRVVKILFLAVVSLWVPGFAQIIAGTAAIGWALFAIYVAACVTLHISASLALFLAGLAAVLISVLSSEVLLFRRREVVLSKGKVGALFIVMMIVSGLSSAGPELRAFSMGSGSMLPSLKAGEVILAREAAAEEMRRGDIIVFRKPSDNKTDYVKRLVGLPGERIQLKGGVVFVNGTPVQRQRIDDFATLDNNGNVMRAPQYMEVFPDGVRDKIIEYAGDNGVADNTPEYVVPDRHFFVMGDNRDNSADSRFLTEVGYIPFENVRYSARWVIRPVPREIERF